MQLFLTDSDFYLDIEVEDVGEDEERSCVNLRGG